VAEARWRTLPLFGTPAPPGASDAHRRPRSQTPLDLVLHIYWAASVEAHALGSLAARTPYPDQRRALRALQQHEEDRKTLAARLLATIWHVPLPGPPTRIKDGEDGDRGRGVA
jgi:hypothetical protein